MTNNPEDHNDGKQLINSSIEDNNNINTIQNSS